MMKDSIARRPQRECPLATIFFNNRAESNPIGRSTDSDVNCPSDARNATV